MFVRRGVVKIAIFQVESAQECGVRHVQRRC